MKGKGERKTRDQGGKYSVPRWRKIERKERVAKWSDSEMIAEFFSRSFFLLAELFLFHASREEKKNWTKESRERKEQRERERGRALTWLRFGEASSTRWTDSPRQTGALSEEMDRWSGSCSIAPRAESKSRCVYSRTFVFRSCPSSPRIGGWKIQPLGWFTTASIRPSIPLVRQM